MKIEKNNQLLGRARELRREMTPQERKLWYLLLRPYPLKFYKQRIIDSYIVDFYCAPAKLVIEIDGSQHYTKEGQEQDEGRSAMLRRYGLVVLRFSNREINEEFDAVCEMIHRIVQERVNEL